ncbi:MAG: hypothetical protein ACXWP0_12115, partial [Ktedonobacterales bacterium]
TPTTTRNAPMTDDTTPIPAKLTAPPLAALGGRKFCLVVACLALAVTAIALDIQVPADLLDFIKWVVGLYMAGNVGKTLVTKVTGNSGG